MSRTYQATGIILKGMPLGEADRLVTILTPEFGLIRAVAPGARKHKSRLRGRSELFVVNQLLLAKGRSLDKITQVETLESYPGLSRDLGKLSASQYLAELVLCLALSEQPQTELYELLNEHLRRLEQLADSQNLSAHLAQAVFHILALAGMAPQVHHCCLTQTSLSANFNDPRWRVGFSFDAGGLIRLTAETSEIIQPSTFSSPSPHTSPSPPSPSSPPSPFLNPASAARINTKLGAVELTLLQHLGSQTLPQPFQFLPPESFNPSVDVAWVKVERLLRDYAQYHFGRSFRAAALVDTLSSLDF
ncbi:MAG: DNA repair protein RecO [Microcystaceae cyanobacterium]